MARAPDPLDLPPWWCRDERCLREDLHKAHEITKRPWTRHKSRPSRFMPCASCAGGGCRACNGSGVVLRKKG